MLLLFFSNKKNTNLDVVPGYLRKLIRYFNTYDCWRRSIQHFIHFRRHRNPFNLINFENLFPKLKCLILPIKQKVFLKKEKKKRKSIRRQVGLN